MGCFIFPKQSSPSNEGVGCYNLPHLNEIRTQILAVIPLHIKLFTWISSKHHIHIYGILADDLSLKP